MEKRKDRFTALYIDAALNTCSTHGVEVAALAMAERGISFETVLRVLTSPRRRRGPGQRHYVAPEDYSAALAAALTAS
jgi:hypothetical protein